VASHALRVAGGMVRAQEDAGQRKWEEMNQLARLLSPKKREMVSKANSRKIYFTFIFPL
jgi:hypothetical protein